MGIVSQDIEQQIDRYASGPEMLRAAIAGLSDSQLKLPVPPGKWSCLEVVCHISDFELVYADRIKRVVAEDRPTLFGGDPDQFAARLAYNQRDIDEELSLIESVRHHVTRFLRTLDQEAFQREGIHSVDGPISLATLVKRIANHIPHHVDYIQQKRSNL